MSDKKAVLIDAHALIHRAYHALPPLTTSKGEPINAVYGFSKILFQIIKTLKPDYLSIAFDSRAPTFRHLEYREYKANRPPAPDDLKKQFPLVREFVSGLSLPFFAVEGYEADDLIGTLVSNYKKEIPNINILIVTGDWDNAQLIDERVKLYKSQKKIDDQIVVDKETVFKKFGVRPDQIIDFKALKGDSSDNIPGIKGIGDKTAALLLQKWNDLDNIYSNLEEIESKYRQKLEENKENAYLSRKLATISNDFPIDFDLSDQVWRGWDEEKVNTVFDKFEFYSLKKIFTSPQKKEKDQNEQLSLV